MNLFLKGTNRAPNGISSPSTAQVLRITCDVYLQGSFCSLGKQWIKVKTSSTEKPANVQSKFQNPLKEIKEMFPYTSQVIYPSFEEAEVKLVEEKKKQSK